MNNVINITNELDKKKIIRNNLKAATDILPQSELALLLCSLVESIDKNVRTQKIKYNIK